MEEKDEKVVAKSSKPLENEPQEVENAGHKSGDGGSRQEEYTKPINN